MVFNKLDDLSTNEIILMEGRANWDTPFNAKGGKLFLTNKRIIFKANKLNFGTKYFECNLDDVYIENNTVPIFVIWNIDNLTPFKKLSWLNYWVFLYISDTVFVYFLSYCNKFKWF